MQKLLFIGAPSVLAVNLRVEVSAHGRYTWTHRENYDFFPKLLVFGSSLLEFHHCSAERHVMSIPTEPYHIETCCLLPYIPRYLIPNDLFALQSKYIDCLVLYCTTYAVHMCDYKQLDLMDTIDKKKLPKTTMNRMKGKNTCQIKCKVICCWLI